MVMKMKLNDREWKGFKIDDVFNTDKGAYLHQNKILKGNNPYISAKAINNGVTDFIGNNTLFQKNTVTIEKVKLSAFINLMTIIVLMMSELSVIST